MELIRMPRLGITMQSGTLLSWRKKTGDMVQIGEPLFEIESDKSTLEVESPHAGFLKAILVEPGQEVPCDTIVGVLGDENEVIDPSHLNLQKKQDEGVGEDVRVSRATSSVNENEKVHDAGRPSASPKARKLAQDLEVDLQNIKGSGPGGAILEKDVRDAQPGGLMNSERIHMNDARQRMAHAVSQSWSDIPHFVQMITVNADRVMRVKKEIAGVSINDIMIKCVANAVRAHPIVNSTLRGDSIVVYKDVNVSVAMEVDDALIVPVIKNADIKGVSEISREVRALREKAEKGFLRPQDMKDGTITLSNLGAAGIETGTAIINPPQSTIVFVGAIRKVPVVDEKNEIVVGRLLQLSITYDHRFIDGTTASRFTNAVKAEIEAASRDRLEHIPSNA